MTEPSLMKDSLGPQAVQQIAAVLARVVPGFSPTQFTREALRDLGSLELKQRVDHLIAVIHAHLPSDFPEAARLLARVSPSGPPDGEAVPLKGFAAWPVIDYVAVHGLEHPDIALDLLADLTGLFTAEFALRPFILQHWKQVEQRLRIWCRSSSPAVRRLVSEGTRPRLPWGIRLPPFVQDPSPTLPFLEQLKDDPDLVVRRSVANHLNDISKDHPETVVALGKRWLEDGSPETRWVVRHACRTLIKAGCPEAFPLLGFTEAPRLEAGAFQLSASTIAMGETLVFSFSLKSLDSRKLKLAVDYAVHHQKANGKQRAKVFKLREVTMAPGSDLVLEKKHAFKAITTRAYHNGEHAIEWLVNGQSVGRQDFFLTGCA